MAAYRKFIHWTYNRVGRGICKVIPCYVAVDEFPKIVVSILVLSWLSCSLLLHYLYHKHLCT